MESKIILRAQWEVGIKNFEDPAFLKYLKYFIYGAELPWELKVALQAAKSYAYYEDEFVDDAFTVVKRYRASVSGGYQHFADEIFKIRFRYSG